MKKDIDAFIKVGTEAAHEASRLIMRRFRTDVSVSRKGAVNLVTDVDLAAEELIVGRITKAFPDHKILAEENYSEAKGGDHVWIVDPLDGTTNFAHGLPVFAVSIGLAIGGQLEWGIIVNPNLNETFTARLGKGAFCNGVPVHVSKIDSLQDGLLTTGFPYDIRTSPDNNLAYFSAFALRAQAVRRAGSAAVDFCWVAAGRYDGFWELKLHPWDCAAGYLMVREAGGMVTNFLGHPGSIYDPEVIASNGKIHEEMLTLIHEVASLTKLERGS